MVLENGSFHCLLNVLLDLPLQDIKWASSSHHNIMEDLETFYITLCKHIKKSLTELSQIQFDYLNFTQRFPPSFSLSLSFITLSLCFAHKCRYFSNYHTVSYLNIKLVSHFLLAFVPQLPDTNLTDLVAKGLARPSDVPS